MRVELRETGSIRVSARKDAVIDVLRRSVRGSAVHGDRVEAEGTSYVVREAGEATLIYHARRETANVTTAARERESLRQAVKSDLFELRRVFDVGPG